MIWPYDKDETFWFVIVIVLVVLVVLVLCIAYMSLDMGQPANARYHIALHAAESSCEWWTNDEPHYDGQFVKFIDIKSGKHIIVSGNVVIKKVE